MNCDRYPRGAPHASLIRHTCYYTLASLRGFPILACNMVLVLMIRILVQTRMYYTMLKLTPVGSDSEEHPHVVHFASKSITQTPYTFACGISMAQGAMHFLLKS